MEGIIAVSLTEVMDRTMAGESVYPDSPPNPEFGGAAKLDLSEREQAVLRELTRNIPTGRSRIGCTFPSTPCAPTSRARWKRPAIKSHIDLAVNAKALELVVHEGDRTENRSQRGGKKT